MDTPATLAVVVGIFQIALIPILKVMWDRIKEAKQEGIAQAAIAIKEVTSTAEESKRLAIEAQVMHNTLRVHLAENYTSLKRLEQLETALFKKLDAIESKQDDLRKQIDGKADKP